MCIRDRGNGTGTADGALALAAAVGMVVGVHDGTADCGPDAQMALAAGFSPVSYTHLDVYKRQVLLLIGRTLHRHGASFHRDLDLGIYFKGKLSLRTLYRHSIGIVHGNGDAARQVDGFFAYTRHRFYTSISHALPDVGQYLSANIVLPGLLIGHHALAGAKDRNPQPAQYAGHLVLPGVHPKARLADPPLSLIHISVCS